MNFDFSVFGERLKSLRKQNKKTQKELAKELGISPASIIYYEKAQKMPTIDTVIKIANYFHVSLDWLCGLNDELPPGNQSENGRDFINLSGVLRILSSICCVCSDVHTEDCSSVTRAVLIFEQREIVNFVSKWKNVYRLYKSGVIKQEMYSDWIKGIIFNCSKTALRS